MLNLVLLGGKIAFLVVLYWFVFLVIRSSTRDLRVLAQRVAPPAGSGDGPAAAVVPPAAPQRASGGWALVVVESPHTARGRSFVVPIGGAATVGRSGDADLQLPDTFVSSHHARLRAEEGGLVVEDLGSTNGTEVNGEAVTLPTLVTAGDEVAVGDTVFRVEAR